MRILDVGCALLPLILTSTILQRQAGAESYENQLLGGDTAQNVVIFFADDLGCVYKS